MKKIYIVMENWGTDIGQNNVEIKNVYSSFKKALNYLLLLKKSNELDFNTKERQKEIYINQENIDKKNKIANVLVTFNNNNDYYNLWIEKKIINKK